MSSGLHDFPIWRSLLFVPAHVEKFIQSAPKRKADAIILDMEDSVPAEQKSDARESLSVHIKDLAEQGQQVVVRVNQPISMVAADLDVAVVPETRALILPKVLGAEHLQLLDESIAGLEEQRNIPVGSIRLIAMIESLDGLQKVQAIAHACDRVLALALGTEDLALDGGFDATPENLFHPAQQMVFAAKQAGKLAFGFPGSIAHYHNLEAYGDMQKQAKSMGFDGALCIHPSQVESVNSAYAASSADIEQAKEIVNRFEQALSEKRGAVEVDGKMVDAPVYEKALSLLKSV